MVYSIISKSELEGALRLDAEYYCAGNLIKKDFILGNGAAQFIQYGTSEELNDEGKGFPVLRLNEFDEIFVGKPAKFCNKINEEEFKNLKLKKGDVLICRTNGNPKLVGKAAIVMDDQDIAFASYLFRVRPGADVINSSVLVTFLNSKFGRQQIEKYLMPSIQSNFSPAKFREIRIPRFSPDFQNEINRLVKETYMQKQSSDVFYSQAENLLLEELGLKNFKIEDDLSFVVSLSDVKSSHRADSDYFQPKYEMIIKKIKDKNPKIFTEVIENIQVKFNPSKYPDKTYHYVELANINSSLGIIDGFSEVLGKEAPSRAKRLLKEGDVVVSSIGGSLDKVALVDIESEESLASTGFFQLRSKEILPEVLLVLAKSIILRMQLEKQVSGTILAAIPNETLKNIIVPILSKETQQKIADLVQKSHEARKKSKQLLDEAKRKVEDYVERGRND